MTELEIQEVATKIASMCNAEKVILFGSRARGDMRADSDVDLLIIAESDQPRHKRTRTLYERIRPYPFPMDLIMYTPEEIKRAMESQLSFASRVMQEGKVLYERESPRSVPAIARQSS